VWEVGAGKPPARLRGHRSGVEALAFNPDGSRLVALSRYGDGQEAKLWDLTTNQELLTLTAGRPLAADFRLPMHFDGKRLLLPAWDESLPVMRVFDGTPARRP
jgi:WD40 repeat protein